MSATAATTGRPVWAVTAWLDDIAVYVELPYTDGPPYIEKFPLHEAGLSKALNLMRSLHRKAQPNGGRYAILDHPKLTASAASAFTPAQRDKASAILRKLKIT